MAHTITVSIARSIVREFARNAGDSTMYSDAQIDFAIQTSADELIRLAFLLPNLAQLTLSANVSALPDFSATTFRPDRLQVAYLTGSNVQVGCWNGYDGLWDPSYRQAAELECVTIGSLLEYQIGEGVVGQPAQIAFDTWTTGQVYPQPDQDYTLNLRWLDFFTAWTPGAEDSGTLNTLLNLPDDMMRKVLSLGAPAFMQYNEPEHAYASSAGKAFMDWITSMKGTGNLGAQVIEPNRRRH